MRYLFDTLTKNTQTLAGLYKYTKEGDEFRLYDPNAVPIENFDVRLLGQLEKRAVIDDSGNSTQVISVPGLDEKDIKKENGKLVYTKKPEDSRMMLSTLDFDKALSWCDVYVCMVAPEANLNEALDTHKELDKIKDLINRLMRAVDMGKKVFLGNRENELYRKVIAEHEGCLNHIIDKKDLENILSYKGAFFEDFSSRQTKITFVISTSGASGKMSNVLKIRNSFEKTGETTAVIITEEIADFLDKDKYHIYPFLREFCDISLDEEILYLRCLIEKIVFEVNPDRILITGQGSFGPQQTLAAYTPDDCKPRGVLSNILLSAIGCDSVAIMTPYTLMKWASNLVEYFRLTSIDIDEVCISPMDDTFEKDEINIAGVRIPVNRIGCYDEVFQSAAGFMMNYPQIPVFCKYMNITDRLNELVSTREFFELWKDLSTKRILRQLNIRKKEFMEMSGNAMFNRAIGKNLESISRKDVNCSDELWAKVVEEAEKLKL